MTLTKSLIFTVLLTLSASLLAQVGVGTTNPHSSSILEINSSNKGFLPPRMSLSQRKKINSPANGLLIYNTTLNCIQIFNGTDWYDLCCSQKVKENLSAINYLYRLDPSKENNFSKMDLDPSYNGSNANQIPEKGDYVYSANMVNSENNTTATLEYVAGLQEPSLNATGDGIFIYQDETSSLDYQQKNFITRTVAYSGGSISFNGSRIEADIPNLQQEMEMFIVGKFNGDTQTSSTSFFASADNPDTHFSFQIGAGASASTIPQEGCRPDYFTLRFTDENKKWLICGAADQSPDGLDRRVSSGSNQLHVFNMRSYKEVDDFVLEFYIDGELLTRIDTLSGYPLIDKLKLFTNRVSRNSAVSSIGELLISDKLFSNTEHEEINNYLLCKYAEH